MNVLQNYKTQPGSFINKEKSVFLIYHKTTDAHIREVEECTIFSTRKFPLIYLGCPIGHRKKKKVHFSELMKKVHKKLQTWKGKMISFSGNVVLINNELNNIPIYLVSAITS